MSDGVGSACADAEHKARHNSPCENIELGWVKPWSSLSSNLALRVDTVGAEGGYKSKTHRENSPHKTSLDSC